MSDWKARRVFLIGGGPSLTGFDFDRLKGHGLVIAVNDAFRVALWADAVVSIDTVWLRRRRELLQQFCGEKIGIVPSDWTELPPGYTRFRRVSASGLSDWSGGVCTGNNSGYAALGLAIMRGASEIYLLGYDMTGPGHFHGGYEWPCRFGHRNYSTWAALFGSLAAPAHDRGVSVFNCNSQSAIRCFPFADIDEVLSDRLSEGLHARTFSG